VFQRLGVPTPPKSPDRVTSDHPITLAPGATGTAMLQVADALNFPTATCGPAKATELRVYAPNQTAAVYLPDSSEGCAQPVQVRSSAPCRPTPSGACIGGGQRGWGVTIRLTRRAGRP
jgi:hypothetical protein